QVGPGVLAAADLVDRRRGVGRGGVGHRLHGDRRVAADRHVADHDLATRAAVDRAPGTNRVHLEAPWGDEVDTVDTVDTVLAEKLPTLPIASRRQTEGWERVIMGGPLAALPQIGKRGFTAADQAH